VVEALALSWRSSRYVNALPIEKTMMKSYL
jgi:hypothetical protein